MARLFRLVVGIQAIVITGMALLTGKNLEVKAESILNETTHSHDGLTSVESWANTNVTQVSESQPDVAYPDAGKPAKGDGESEDYSSESSQGQQLVRWNVIVSEQHKTVESTAVLNRMLGFYDTRIRPDFGGPPTIVACSVFVLSMDEVTEVTMDYGMTILLEEYWNDPRLSYANFSNLPHITSGMGIAGRIWVPDLFFANEKRASFHAVTVHNRMIRVYPDGDVFYSMKLSLVLYCHMDFKAFPMDKQRCKTSIESYQSTEDELQLLWKEPAITMGPEISLPQYAMQSDIPFGSCWNRVSSEPSKANFSCIEFSFTLVRELTFYIIQTYIPTGLLVLISWVSFWIDIGQAAARVSLGVTTVLTMTTTTVGYGAFAGLPKVSYTKAIDLWFDACLSFVIGSLFEYAIVHYLWTKDKAEKHIRWAASRDSFQVQSPYGTFKSHPHNHQNNLYGSSYKDQSSRDRDYSDPERDSQSNSRYGSRYNYQTNYRTVRNTSYNTEGDPEGGYSKLQQEELACLAERKRSKLFALRIDRLSRVMFPLAFIAFIVTYWVCYYTVYVTDIPY